MSDTASAAVSAPAATPKKKGSASKVGKKPKSVPTHPKVSEMVTSAITSLKERGGSSLQAIKKHIASNNKVDIERLSPFIKKYLKSAVVSGALVQTKGKGATGSFKLSGQKTKESAGTTASKPKVKKPAAAKKEAVKRTAKSGEKKKAAVKKPGADKKKKTVKKSPAKKPATKARTPKKSVKATKPKSPKPKKAKTAKKAAAKKPSKK